MVDIHVNGVARGKPRPAVIGGVVRNCKGELLSFPRPDEFKNLNEAELSATGHALLIPKDRFMDQQFTIAGNAKHALDRALKEEHPWWIGCLERDLGPAPSATAVFSHIYKGIKQVDLLAKQGGYGFNLYILILYWGMYKASSGGSGKKGFPLTALLQYVTRIQYRFSFLHF